MRRTGAPGVWELSSDLGGAMDLLIGITAVLGVIIGSVGVWLAWRANRHAKEANELSEQTARRVLEDHDVWWAPSFPEPRVFALTNAGRDVAHDVRVDAEFSGRRANATPDEVPAGESVRMDTSPETAKVQRDVAAHRRQREVSRSSTYPGLHMPFTPFGYTEWRVSWLSAAGTRHSAHGTEQFHNYGVDYSG